MLIHIPDKTDPWQLRIAAGSGRNKCTKGTVSLSLSKIQRPLRRWRLRLVGIWLRAGRFLRMRSKGELMISKSQTRNSMILFRIDWLNGLTVVCWMPNLSANVRTRKGRLPGNQAARILTFMGDVTTTIQRQHQRIQVKIPIVANGVDKNGRPFTEPTQTINGSLGGMALLLDHVPSPSSCLLISILHRQHPLHLQTEVRHVTLCKDKNIVGVKFRGVQNDFLA